MPTLAVETVRTGGVTFVEVIVEADRPYQVRIESRLDGPVWPPRENGRPVEGWDERGARVAVDAGRTALGFGTPAPADPPVVELVDVEPHPGGIAGGLPEGVSAWLRQVEGRLENAEALERADDLSSATSAVASAGGLAGVDELAADLARDRRALSQLSLVPDELDSRASEVSVSTELFARLAAPPTTALEDRDTCSGR